MLFGRHHIYLDKMEQARELSNSRDTTGYSIIQSDPPSLTNLGTYGSPNLTRTMSLYHEAEQFISASDLHSDSLKCRIYGAKGLKSTAAQLFALVSEASKWSFVVKEVVEKSQLLVHERKVRASFVEYRGKY